MSSYDLVPSKDEADKGRPLTGWRVLAMLLAFFGVIGSVNAVMVYSALSTFSGEVDAHPYEHGIAYNRDIASAREQAALGWKVVASLTRLPSGETEIVVLARDANGADISGIEIAANLASPVDKKQDVSAKPRETAPGRFEARVVAAPGVRDLVLTASRGGVEVFRSHNRLLIE
ncbi:MAG: FixH family protein [Methylocystis sp.]